MEADCLPLPLPAGVYTSHRGILPFCIASTRKQASHTGFLNSVSGWRNPPYVFTGINYMYWQQMAMCTPLNRVAASVQLQELQITGLMIQCYSRKVKARGQ